MSDPRFFKKSEAVSLALIAAKCEAELADSKDGDFMIDDVGALDTAGPAELSFLDNKKYKDQFRATKAGACITLPEMKDFAPKDLRLLLSKNPYKSYALAGAILYPARKPSEGVSGEAKIHLTARIGNGCTIGAFAVIGEDVEIGDGTWIEPHAVIGDSVIIGKNCHVGSHASVSHSLIGDNVNIYAGCRIGQDGFGFAIDRSGFTKVTQLGRVIIEGHSEIGANTTIDRGALGDTVIGMGSWLDNQIQIAHNVKIGKGCVIAAQVGISGSTTIGDYTMIGGQAGFAGHLKIGSMVRIAAKSGVTRNVPDKEEWMGYPAIPMKQFLRHTGLLNRMTKRNKD